MYLPLARSFQGKEYEWVKTRYTQSEAQSYAEEAGGHLVVINSQAENDFITTNMIFGPNQGCNIIDGGSGNYFLDQLEPTSSR